MKQTTEQCLYLYHAFSGCVALVGASSFRCKLGFSLESHSRLDCVVRVLTSRRKHFSFHCGRQSTAVNGLAESGRAVRSCRLLFFRSRSFLLLNKTSKQPASAVFFTERAIPPRRESTHNATRRVANPIGCWRITGVLQYASPSSRVPGQSEAKCLTTP